MQTKKCKSCNKTKPTSDFYFSSKKEDNLDYYCKFCRNGASIKSQKNVNQTKQTCSIDGCERPHYALTYCRVHYARQRRTGSTERQLISLTKNSEYYYNSKQYRKKAYMLKYHYKMSIEEFNQRIINGCELCGDMPEASLQVDHDHKCCPGMKSCGACVRGIICNSCNKAIDQYETNSMRSDYPEIKRIKKYLKKYKRNK